MVWYLLSLTVGLSSCLQETPLPVVIDFTAQSVVEHSTTPLVVQLTNATKGADFYEWTFEGGEPASSSEKLPPKITFKEPGEHKITLRAWNIAAQSSHTLTIQADSAVTAAFDHLILTNDFAPAQVQLINKTNGATSFQWTFSGGTPETSTEQNPRPVTFDSQGEHHITLTATNGSQTFSVQHTITVTPPLEVDFQIEISPQDQDMEAPLTATLTNTSTSCVNTLWSCAQANISNKNASTTSIRFAAPGTYTVELTADNIKQSQTVQKQITVKPNSGIHRFRNMELGIIQAQNSIGCLFSSDLKRVLKSNETTTANGAQIDFGFYAINSNFDYCYFFSPDRATAATFAEIPHANTTFIDNAPLAGITPQTFHTIATADQLDQYTYPTTHSTQTFALDRLPMFFALKTKDERRGLIYIKDVIAQSKQSFIVADIIIEKRIND